MLAKIQIVQTYHKNLPECIDKILQKCIYDVTQAGKFDMLQDLCINVIVYWLDQEIDTCSKIFSRFIKRLFHLV